MRRVGCATRRVRDGRTGAGNEEFAQCIRHRPTRLRHEPRRTRNEVADRGLLTARRTQRSGGRPNDSLQPTSGCGCALRALLLDRSQLSFSVR